MLDIMKILKNLLFALFILFGASLATSAQSNDNRKIPPKDPPPVVKPGDKPADKPRGDKGQDKPKKPRDETSASAQLVEEIFT